MSSGTVRSRIFRAREEIVNYFKEELYEKIDINQLISAYYDNELTESELDLLLEETKKDPDLLAKLIIMH